MHVRHAQFNRKSAIFGLQIGSFQGRSFPTAGQRNEDAGYEGGAVQLAKTWAITLLLTYAKALSCCHLLSRNSKTLEFKRPL